MIRYIDTHCHFMNLMPPLSGLVYNAVRESDWNIVLAAPRCAGVYCAVGTHPWFVGDMVAGWDSRMRTILVENPNLMVGEIGLDRARGDFDAQMPVFARQMELAAELGRAAHLHCVRAWDVVLNYFANNKLPPVIVAHGFRGGADVALAALRHANIYFSFKDADSSRARDALTVIPTERILIESDAYTADDSLNILARVAHQIAEIKSVDTAEMTEIIYNNTLRMLKNG